MARVIVPDVGRVARKWANRAQGAGQDYTDGVNLTSRSWQANTTAAAQNFKTGVAAAAAAGRFEKGVARAGDAKWKKGASEKGPARYAQGVSLGENDYSSQVAPYLQAIGAVDLPPRGPARSPQNINRVSAIAKALGDLKEKR